MGDRLPPTLQGRVRLGIAHIGVLAITVALGLAVAAWWVISSADDGLVLTPVVETAAADRPAEAGGSLLIAQELSEQSDPTGAQDLPAAQGSSAAGVVVVDVAGEVVRPGIVTLPAGSRVADAVEAAGGALPDADTTTVNLARVLADAEQILVGVPPPTGVAAAAAGSSPSAPTLINLNSADLAALDGLPGVGPVTAQAILTWRAEHGPFRSVDQLLEVSGIGEATLAKLAAFVTL